MDFKRIRYFFGLLLPLSVMLSSCSSGDEPDNGQVRDTTILIYAVASNSLSSALVNDKQEMLTAASSMDLDGLSLLLYEVNTTGNPKLSKLVKDKDGTPSFHTVKEYDRSIYSTDPRRISEVIEYTLEYSPARTYGLVLWSHGTGLDPSFSSHSLSRTDPQPGNSMCWSFGQDINQDKDAAYSDRTDIDELADAIPDHVFQFIWFDACYMSGIETVYELRDKCDYFVGYATEVYAPGMPYDLTLPHILRKIPDLQGGAKAFFDYYAYNSDSRMRSATVAYLDMKKIEPVADFCKATYVGASAPSTASLQCYTRGGIGPFYDFGQYSRLMAASGSSGISSDILDSALSDFVIWSAATDLDFSYKPIVKKDFSGISCHRFVAVDNSSKNSFYKTLDWYKRVYE